MKQDLQVAILFNKIVEDSKVEIFQPVRTLIGTLDKDGMKFYDAISHNIFYNLDNYSNTDNYYGFYYSLPISDFLGNDSYTSLIQNINDYLKEMQKKTYFYSLETGTREDYLLKSLPNDEFNEKYGLKIIYPESADNIKEVNFNDIIKANEEIINIVEETENSYQLSLPPINELYEKIRKNVLCQDNQIKKILTAVYKNLTFEEQQLKSNIFIYGPSGVGKTAIINQIGANLNIPVVIEDIQPYTIAGYKGKDCTDALRRMYYAANGDIEVAEHGILVFDEIDKKHSKGANDEGVSSDGVLYSLLKIAEGGIFEVEIGKNGEETINFDTSHLTVIVSGAFEKLFNVNKNNNSIGFNSSNESINRNDNADIIKKLINYGIPKEFIGRFNTIVRLNSLTKNDLKNILLNSESSVLRLFTQNLANHLGVTLKFSDNNIDRICDLAYSQNTGARALNSIVSELLDDALFSIFSDSEQNKEITIDGDVLDSKKLVKTIVK